MCWLSALAAEVEIITQVVVAAVAQAGCLLRLMPS